MTRIALLALFLSSCSLDRFCTAVWCSEGAHIDVALPASNARVEVCRNDRCSTIELDATGHATYIEQSLAVDYEASQGTPGSLLVNDGAFADGDRYRVVVRDLDGAQLATYEWIATYTRSYPNGEDCDPQPCWSTELDASNAL